MHCMLFVNTADVGASNSAKTLILGKPNLCSVHLSHTQFGFGSATAVETVETAVVVVLVYNGVRIKGRSLGGCWA